MKLSYCTFRYRSKCTKRLLWKSAQTLTDKRQKKKKNVNMNLQVLHIHAGLSITEWVAPLSHKICCKDTQLSSIWMGLMYHLDKIKCSSGFCNQHNDYQGNDTDHIIIKFMIYTRHLIWRGSLHETGLSLTFNYEHKNKKHAVLQYCILPHNFLSSDTH
jgi:hypothetical protein